MPSAAQDRVRRGPLAALLILFGLLLSSGPAAAGSGLREPAVRLGPARQAASTAILPPGTRNPLDDEASGAGAFLPPSATGIVTAFLWSRPAAEAPSGAFAALPEPARASYRARAPPAP